MPWIKARDDMELFVKDRGRGNDRPVILIHGYPLNAGSFDRTAIKGVQVVYGLQVPLGPSDITGQT